MRSCLCCGFTISFIGSLLFFPHQRLYSTSVWSSAFGRRSQEAKEDRNRNGKCFDRSFSITVAFDLDWIGLTNQRIGLLHGFAVAYQLGAETVLEPRLRIGLSPGVVREDSLERYYDTGILRKALRELNLTLRPDRPNVKTVNFTASLRQDMQGEPMHLICSRIRDGLVHESANIVVNLGSAPGLLRIDERNLGLISFIDKHLEYNSKIKLAVEAILAKLPVVFNGLHLPAPEELDKTSKLVIPEKIVPKIMQLGFQRNTTLFVASGVPMQKLAQSLQPYAIATLENFSEGLPTLDALDFAPINELVLEKAKEFTGFSLANDSLVIAARRWLNRGLCDKSYDSERFFNPWPAPLFLWRGALPFGPSCHDNKNHSTVIFPKRVVSESCRFIYFAGLEGTGHHFWQKMLPNLNPSKQWACDLSDDLWWYFATTKEAVRSKYLTRVKQLISDANRQLSSQTGAIVPLNVLCEKGGMHSYPSFGGDARAIQIPDLLALAKLAQDVKVDLRIVVMLRDPEKVVSSGLRRGFERDFLHAIKRYTSVLASMKAQLDLLDPSFITCWTYEKPTAGISELVSFMGSRHDPTELQRIIQKDFRQDHISPPKTPSTEMPEAWGTIMATYHEINAKYCSMQT
eukprot:Skav233478  [mRNA]  locus=scaffold1310:45576:47465:+ [translate_table: standard]